MFWQPVLLGYISYKDALDLSYKELLDFDTALKFYAKLRKVK